MWKCIPPTLNLTNNKSKHEIKTQLLYFDILASFYKCWSKRPVCQPLNYSGCRKSFFVDTFVIERFTVQSLFDLVLAGRVAIVLYSYTVRTSPGNQWNWNFCHDQKWKVYMLSVFCFISSSLFLWHPSKIYLADLLLENWFLRPHTTEEKNSHELLLKTRYKNTFG